MGSARPWRRERGAGARRLAPSSVRTGPSEGERLGRRQTAAQPPAGARGLNINWVGAGGDAAPVGGGGGPAERSGAQPGGGGRCRRARGRRGAAPKLRFHFECPGCPGRRGEAQPPVGGGREPREDPGRRDRGRQGRARPSDPAASVRTGWRRRGPGGPAPRAAGRALARPLALLSPGNAVIRTVLGACNLTHVSQSHGASADARAAVTSCRRAAHPQTSPDLRPPEQGGAGGDPEEGGGSPEGRGRAGVRAQTPPPRPSLPPPCRTFCKETAPKQNRS